ncbi:MAG: hypothetical protein A2091_13180 [Desulfuromonadales bacterium GWD2_61_12]|nr:MAG: hypothetical protein A2005_03690 [Desulfuromonadales bacterium GWC2_61_20]OGR35490.1 MAG: hypothetical protein A2091_13180 [Desulfuromonadales bacterium GWD2_61_12]
MPPRPVGWRQRGRRLLADAVGVGASPSRIAAALALGSTIGLAPVLWGATLTCLFAARLLRWPVLPLQSGNFLVYPLQLLLLVPFFRGGQALVDLLNPPVVGSQPGLLAELGRGQGGALLLWLLLAPLFYLVGYRIWLGLLERWRRRHEQAS